MPRMSVVTLPGLVDVHVHLRNPGGEHKESVQSGTAAALAGGFTAVLAMPNTQPPLSTPDVMRSARRVYGAEARCDVGLFVGATGGNAPEAAAMAPLACGLKIYLNDTFGPLRIERLSELQAHFSSFPSDRPIVLHAEGQSVAVAIGLAATHGRPVHIAHVSRSEEIRLIAAAKEAGLPVTCEVTPHHLFLTTDDLASLGPFGEVRPRLAGRADVEDLWAHLDVVDCVATDHAPHTREEKLGDSPPPGMPGLETALSLMLTAVYEDRLTLDRLVDLMATTPARLFGLKTPSESAVEVEIGPRWHLPESGYYTKVDWSPFAGREVRGRVLRTRLRGETAYQDGAVLAAPGAGRLHPSEPASPSPSVGNLDPH